MKITFLTNTLVLPDQPGLPRPWRVAKFLGDMGHDVTVIANKRHYLEEELTVGGTIEEPLLIDGIKVIGVETTAGRRKSIVKRLKNYISVSRGFKKAAIAQGRPDLLIVGTPPPIFTPYVGWRLKRKFKCKAILEIRDLYPHSAVGMGLIKNKLLIYIWQTLENFLQKRFDQLVVVVPGMKPMVQEQGIDPDKVTVITNGYDLDNDQAEVLEGDVKDYFDNNKGRFIFSYGGNMGFANDVGLMLGAAELLKDDDRFRFAFFGEGQRKQGYLREVEEKNLTNVQFFPNQSRPVISTVFRSSFALLHAYTPSPLWDYALPNKIFEYHGAARPVIFAGGGDIKNLIETADSGLVISAGDAPALAAAIKELAASPEKADQKGTNGRAYILEHFSREKIFKTWRVVLEGLGIK